MRLDRLYRKTDYERKSEKERVKEREREQTSKSRGVSVKCYPKCHQSVPNFEVIILGAGGDFVFASYRDYISV